MSFSDKLVPFSTLIALELIPGIDNVSFISILADKLPVEPHEQLRQGAPFFYSQRLYLFLFFGVLHSVKNRTASQNGQVRAPW